MVPGRMLASRIAANGQPVGTYMRFVYEQGAAIPQPHQTHRRSRDAELFWHSKCYAIPLTS